LTGKQRNKERLVVATAVKPQAISGVSAGRETIIESVHPSVAATGLGQLIGRICDSIPIKIGGIKLSYLLFALPLAPLGAAMYFLVKPMGQYILTNRSLQFRSTLGGQLKGQAGLLDIDNIAIRVQPGQQFYKAGDLEALNSRGEVILTLSGVPRPERFRQIILEARDARAQNDAALKTIQARG
jgi:hypothetical protein